MSIHFFPAVIKIEKDLPEIIVRQKYLVLEDDDPILRNTTRENQTVSPENTPRMSPTYLCQCEESTEYRKKMEKVVNRLQMELTASSLEEAVLENVKKERERRIHRAQKKHVQLSAEIEKLTTEKREAFTKIDTLNKTNSALDAQLTEQLQLFLDLTSKLEVKEMSFQLISKEKEVLVKSLEEKEVQLLFLKEQHRIEISTFKDTQTLAETKIKLLEDRVKSSYRRRSELECTLVDAQSLLPIYKGKLKEAEKLNEELAAQIKNLTGTSKDSENSLTTQSPMSVEMPVLSAEVPIDTEENPWRTQTTGKDLGVTHEDEGQHVLDVNMSLSSVTTSSILTSDEISSTTIKIEGHELVDTTQETNNNSSTNSPTQNNNNNKNNAIEYGHGDVNTSISSCTNSKRKRPIKVFIKRERDGHSEGNNNNERQQTATWTARNRGMWGGRRRTFRSDRGRRRWTSFPLADFQGRTRSAHKVLRVSLDSENEDVRINYMRSTNNSQVDRQESYCNFENNFNNFSWQPSRLGQGAWRNNW